jgi:DNA-binding PadR family transcriptional regulator
VTAFVIERPRSHLGLKVLLMRGGRGHRRRGGPGFGPWGGFGPGQFGGRHKAGRGDIRAAILALLTEQPMHGYQIIREIGERSEGAWAPSPGSVYPTLQQLTDEGLVRSTETDGKRVYELTDDGRAQAEGREGALPWEEAAEGADDDLVALRDLVFQVMGATRQVAHAGTKAQLASAQQILRSTRKSLYQLLAEDDAGETGSSPDA